MAGKRSPARMTRLVAQWRASGESGARFARRHQIPAWTFWYWCRKASTAAAPESPASPSAAFVPVRVAEESDGHVVEVVLTSGERLQLRPGAPADLVRVVVSALRSPC